MTRAEAEKFYNSLSPEERQYLHEFISYKQSEITNGNATNRHAAGAGVGGVKRDALKRPPCL